jgi:DNA-binding XRE family transcriptional regulator
MFEKLREMRKSKNIKVKDICQALKLETESAYYKKENGKVPFTLEEGKIISDLFSEPIEAIFFENELSC